MLSVVTFKWNSPGYHKPFLSEHVNRLKESVKKHYRKPHRFICITDDPRGLDQDIEAYPLWDDHSTLSNPSWPNGPSCYRRLKIFSLEFERIAGKRFICLDLDIAIVGDVTDLWDREEDFVAYRDPSGEWPYNGSMILMTAGARKEVWEEFDPVESPKTTKQIGFRGSDQAWISHRLGSAEAVFEEPEVTVYKPGFLPSPDAKVVMFFGKHAPWLVPEYQERRRKTLKDLIGKHEGKRIVVMGGAPSLKADLKKVKGDIWISANEHGAKIRKVDYVVAMDASHGETGREMSNYLHEFTDAPIISGEPYADYLLHDWPNAPKRGLSGMIAAWVAWAMGGVVILAGFDAYESKPSAIKMAHDIKAHIQGPVRVVSGPLTEIFGKYDPKEKLEWAGNLDALLNRDGEIRIRVRKPTFIGRDVFAGEELTVYRHQVKRLLKHKMVEEIGA